MRGGDLTYRLWKKEGLSSSNQTWPGRDRSRPTGASYPPSAPLNTVSWSSSKNAMHQEYEENTDPRLEPVEIHHLRLPVHAHFLSCILFTSVFPFRNLVISVSVWRFKGYTDGLAKSSVWCVWNIDSSHDLFFSFLPSLYNFISCFCECSGVARDLLSLTSPKLRQKFLYDSTNWIIL